MSNQDTKGIKSYLAKLAVKSCATKLLKTLLFGASWVHFRTNGHENIEYSRPTINRNVSTPKIKEIFYT